MRDIVRRLCFVAVCLSAVRLRAGNAVLVDGGDVQLVAGRTSSVFKSVGLRRSDLRRRKTFYVQNAANCHCDALLSGP